MEPSGLQNLIINIILHQISFVDRGARRAGNSETNRINARR